jgi:hypothetical protein
MGSVAACSLSRPPSPASRMQGRARVAGERGVAGSESDARLMRRGWRRTGACGFSFSFLSAPLFMYLREIGRCLALPPGLM